MFDESLFGVGGKLFATFDASTFDPNTGMVVTAVIPEYLDQIDPSTGKTTRIAPAVQALSTTVNVNGTVYSGEVGLAGRKPLKTLVRLQ